jgi:hypothetical protein
MPGAEHVAVVDGPVLADAIEVAAAAEALAAIWLPGDRMKMIAGLSLLRQALVGLLNHRAGVPALERCQGCDGRGPMGVRGLGPGIEYRDPPTPPAV